MRSILFSIALVSSALTLTACGGSGGSKSNNSPVQSSNSSVSSSVLSSSSSVSSVSSSSESSSSSSESSTSNSNPYNVSVQSLKDLADFPIGVAVSAGNETYAILRDNANGTAQRAIIEQHFDQLTAGNIMKMSYLQPSMDNFTFTHADSLVNYALDNGIGVHGHAFVWHSDYQVPNWMKTFGGDRAAWSDLLKTHVQTIAAHFTGKVDSWDVVNEAFMDNGDYRNTQSNGQGSLFYQKMGKDYIEEAFIYAREADPTADLYYNDYSLSPGGAKLNAVLAMVDDFQSRDTPIPINGIGFQMHVYMGWPSANTIRNSFQQVVNRGLKVKITELDIPINNPYDGSYNYPNNYQALFTPALANQQKLRYCEIVKAYMDVVPPALRGGITVWGVWDGDTWLNQVLFNNQHQDWPLLFDHNFHPKPALQGVANGLTGADCSAE